MNKLKAIFVSLLVFVGLEVLIKKQEFFWWIILCLIALVFSASLSVVGFRFRYKRRLNFVILPTLYIAGVISIFIFLQKGGIRQIYILGSSIFLGLLLYNIAKTTQKTVEFSEDKSKRILANYVVTLICTFFIYSGITGLSVFLNWPAWVTILIISSITFILAYQSFWFAGLLSKEAWFYILILALMVAEIYWCVVILPVGFIALGCVLFSIYFVFLGITQAYLKQELTKKIVWQHLILSAILLIASLSTARWMY